MLVSFLVLGQIFTFLMALYLFLSSFRPNIYFPYDFIFSFYSSYFFGLFKGLLSLHSGHYRLIKMERLNFSLVLERTL